MDKAVKLLAISIFRKKYFRSLYVIMKITKILYYENLEPYGNSKFLDTNVYYTKHTNTLVHRAIFGITKIQNICVMPYHNFIYCYRDNFVVHYRHYRDIGFSIIA